MSSLPSFRLTAKHILHVNSVAYYMLHYNLQVAAFSYLLENGTADAAFICKFQVLSNLELKTYCVFANEAWKTMVVLFLVEQDFPLTIHFKSIECDAVGEWQIFR